MGFKVIVSKKAQEEIENAIEYYAEINSNLAFRFYSEVTEIYKKLELNPSYQIRLVFIPLKIRKNILNSFLNYEKKHPTYTISRKAKGKRQ